MPKIKNNYLLYIDDIEYDYASDIFCQLDGEILTIKFKTNLDAESFSQVREMYRTTRCLKITCGDTCLFVKKMKFHGFNLNFNENKIEIIFKEDVKGYKLCVK